MDAKTLALAPTLVLLMLSSAAAINFIPDDDAFATDPMTVMSGEMDQTAAEPAADVEPAPEPSQETAPAEPAEPAAAEPVAEEEPILVFADVLLHDYGQVEPSTHKEWTWMVEDPSFEDYDVEMILNTIQETGEWVAYCVEATLEDAGGRVIASSTGAILGDNMLLDWHYADTEGEVTWVGEWKLSLHVQGASLTEFDAKVAVLY